MCIKIYRCLNEWKQLLLLKFKLKLDCYKTSLSHIHTTYVRIADALKTSITDRDIYFFLNFHMPENNDDLHEPQSPNRFWHVIFIVFNSFHFVQRVCFFIVDVVKTKYFDMLKKYQVLLCQTLEYPLEYSARTSQQVSQPAIRPSIQKFYRNLI